MAHRIYFHYPVDRFPPGEHTTSAIPRRVLGGGRGAGAAALCAVSAKGAGSSEDAQQAETLLRAGPSPLSHVQLLSAKAASGERAGTKRARNRSSGAR